MAKNTKQLFVLIGVLAIFVIVFILFILFSGNNTKDTPDDVATEKSIFDLEDVKTISFTNSNGTFSFTLEGDTWYSVEFPDYTINQTKLNNIADEIKNLSTTREINVSSNTSSGLDEYGLGSSPNSLLVTDSSGNTFDMLLGSEISSLNPTEVEIQLEINTSIFYYAMERGTDTVYTVVLANIADSLSSNIADFVEVETIDIITEADINTVTITIDATSVGIKKQTVDIRNEETNAIESSTYYWYLNTNDEQNISVSNMRPLDGSDYTSGEDYLVNLFDSISGLYYASCANCDPTESELVEYGLDNPSVVCKIDYTETSGEQHVFTLYAGAQITITYNGADTPCYFVRANDSMRIYLMPSTFITSMTEIFDLINTNAGDAAILN